MECKNCNNKNVSIFKRYFMCYFISFKCEDCRCRVHLNRFVLFLIYVSSCIVMMMLNILSVPIHLIVVVAFVIALIFWSFVFKSKLIITCVNQKRTEVTYGKIKNIESD